MKLNTLNLKNQKVKKDLEEELVQLKAKLVAEDTKDKNQDLVWL